MPITVNWQQPYTTAVKATATPLTYTAAERSPNVVVEGVATVNAVSRIFVRIILTPIVAGQTLSFSAKVLKFSGAAGTSTYVSTTNPPDSNAVNATTAPSIALGEVLDLNAYLIAAGVAQPVPA
jgi:hypothetical protein